MPNVTDATCSWSSREACAEADMPIERQPDGSQYDEVDLRLMDTFPASDAVARY